MNNLQDRVIAVTGGSKGFGRAIAEALVAQGAHVALLARGQEDLDETVAQLGREQATGFRADVADADSVAAAFTAIGERFGRLDGLVNNAGVARPSPLADVSTEELALQLNVNIAGVIFCTQAALPWLRHSDNPRVVNITSASARHMDEMCHMGVYAASKAAVERLTAEWREELKTEGIGMTAVSPGFASTDFASGWDLERITAAMRAWLGKGPTHDQGMETRDIGFAVAHCFAYPPGVAVDFIEVRPNRPVDKPAF